MEPRCPCMSPASDHPFSLPSQHPPLQDLPAAPVASSTAALSSAPLSSAPGRHLLPALLPLLLSPLTVQNLQGVGTPELDSPHRGPRAQLVGRTHGWTQDHGAQRWAECQGRSQPPQGQCQPGLWPPGGPGDLRSPPTSLPPRTQTPKWAWLRVGLLQEGPGSPMVPPSGLCSGVSQERSWVGVSLSPFQQSFTGDTPHRP